jgi:hypothetical protein
VGRLPRSTLAGTDQGRGAPDAAEPPLQAWKRDLLAAAREIRRPGCEIVASHRAASRKEERTSRGWKLVVDPPLELVSHETHLFFADREARPSDVRAGLATAVNDTGECLLSPL